MTIDIKNKRKYTKIILVTGGMGFIGSNFINTFVKKYPNYLYVNIDLLTYVSNKKNITVNNSGNYAFEKVDIRNIKSLNKIFNKYSPTHIINFAAETHVDKSIENPSVFIETNIVGTHNLLTLAKKYSLKRFHQISTDEVYGSIIGKNPPFDEKSPLCPNNPYSASKASADMLVRAYNRTFKLNTVITRCSNNYGPNQDKTKMIPLFIKLLSENKKIPLYGKGENVREWIHVYDHICGVDLVFHKGKSGEIYNIGSGSKNERTNKDVVKTLLKSLNRSEDYIDYVDDRPGHDFRYSINCNKIKKELGWLPTVSFEKGILETIESYT